MCSSLHDTTTIEDEDTVHMLDRGQTVSNHQGGLTSDEFREGPLDEMFVLGISEGCGLIEDDDRGILQQSSSQCYTLLFTTREVYSSLKVRTCGPSWLMICCTSLKNGLAIL